MKQSKTAVWGIRIFPCCDFAPDCTIPCTVCKTKQTQKANAILYLPATQNDCFSQPCGWASSEQEKHNGGTSHIFI